MKSFKIILLILAFVIITTKCDINEKITKNFQLIENVVRDPTYLTLDGYQRLVVLTSLYDIIENDIQSINEKSSFKSKTDQIIRKPQKIMFIG
jgi:hypothetical protein